MDTMKQFSPKLKTLREEAGLNQSQLADKLGVSRGSISFYENGDRIPDIEFLRKVSEYFNVSADWLLGVSEEPCINGNLAHACRYTGLSQIAISQLHTMSSDDSYINRLGIDFIEKLLDRNIVRYEDCAWHSVFAEIQADRAESHPGLYEDIVDGFAISLHWLDALDETDGNEIKGLEDRVKRAEKLIIEARKPKGQASSHIEISAEEYANLYHNRAIKIIENVAHSAILDYKKYVKEIIDKCQ